MERRKIRTIFQLKWTGCLVEALAKLVITRTIRRSTSSTKKLKNKRQAKMKIQVSRSPLFY